MSIPAFDLGGVLPPFLGSRPGILAYQSPYHTDTEDLVLRFGTTPHRNQLLRGLLDLRAAFRTIGIVNGFQWIDGSFVEDKEGRGGSPPSDIDIVTVFERPAPLRDDVKWQAFAAAYLHTLFDPGYCKAHYRCEAFAIDLGMSGQNTAMLSAFWFGLFSHQRDTFRWKGVVQCPMGDDPVDQPASDELARRGY